MSNPEKIRRAIREISQRKANVTLGEIEWVMDQLKQYCKVTERQNDHQRMYSINGHRFGVCTHLGGSKQLNPAYVRAFLLAMEDVGWL